jgi:hypothetical protein
MPGYCRTTSMPHSVSSGGDKKTLTEVVSQTFENMDIELNELKINLENEKQER